MSECASKEVYGDLKSIVLGSVNTDTVVRYKNNDRVTGAWSYTLLIGRLNV